LAGWTDLSAEPHEGQRCEVQYFVDAEKGKCLRDDALDLARAGREPLAGGGVEEPHRPTTTRGYPTIPEMTGSVTRLKKRTTSAQKRSIPTRRHVLVFVPELRVVEFVALDDPDLAALLEQTGHVDDECPNHVNGARINKKTMGDCARSRST
jgi:hypothetical protein